jgi:hypothetical protein
MNFGFHRFAKVSNIFPAISRSVLTYFSIFGFLLSLFACYFFLYRSVYFCDRLILLYKDADRVDHSIMVELIKFGNITPVHHFRYTLVAADGLLRNDTKKYEFDQIRDAFVPGGFVKSLKRSNNPNTLSESFAMEFEVGGSVVRVDLRDLRGDFLINNSLNRFTYANMGRTVIEVDGRSYPADFMLNKAVQTGSIKSMVTEKIVSNGVIAFVSDGVGKTYYSDITHVYESNTDYLSHAWAISRYGDLLRKEVGPRVNLVANDERRFDLNLPAFDRAAIKMKKIVKFASNVDTYDFLAGEVSDTEGKR